MKHNDSGGQTWLVTPDLLGFMDKNGKFVDSNPAWMTLLGYSAEQVANFHFTELVHPDDIKRTLKGFEQASGGEPVLNFVNRYRRADGAYHWISWHAVPEATGIFCSGRCVTAEKENEAALKTREDEAALREQFIAVLGHDVRNPLAAINAASRMIGRASKDEHITEMVESIQGSTGRIARLIDDVMDFARARLGGGLNVGRYDDYDIQPILEQTVSEIALAHPATEIITEYDFCDPINCDAGRIGQMISNLLANAVQHGAEGEIVTLSAYDEAGIFYLTVTNSGTPIPDDVALMLFEPFSRGGADQSAQGLGLGLFISREIARAHGGDLTMNSDESGTVFTFRMPRRR